MGEQDFFLSTVPELKQLLYWVTVSNYSLRVDKRCSVCLKMTEVWCIIAKLSVYRLIISYAELCIHYRPIFHVWKLTTLFIFDMQ